jgi:signal transduction histidine kinase
VEDDGAGFDTRAAAAGNGVRRSIVARMLAAGGSARLDSRPGEGTRVVLRAPVRRPAFVAGVRS